MLPLLVAMRGRHDDGRASASRVLRCVAEREPVLRGAYLATARVLPNELRAEVEHAETMLVAGEEELRRCHLQRLAALRNEVARRAKAKATP